MAALYYPNFQYIFLTRIVHHTWSGSSCASSINLWIMTLVKKISLVGTSTEPDYFETRSFFKKDAVRSWVPRVVWGLELSKWRLNPVNDLDFSFRQGYQHLQQVMCFKQQLDVYSSTDPICRLALLVEEVLLSSAVGDRPCNTIVLFYSLFNCAC